jgi:hypothetical protein
VFNVSGSQREKSTMSHVSLVEFFKLLELLLLHSEAFCVKVTLALKNAVFIWIGIDLCWGQEGKL